MQKERQLKHRVLSRRLDEINRLYPGLLEQIRTRGYREPMLSDEQVSIRALQIIRRRIDPEDGQMNLRCSENPEDAMYACLLLSFSQRTVAIESLAKGLESKKDFVRRACARILCDLFVLGQDEAESWEALDKLLKANERYIPEATQELKRLFEIDGCSERMENENLFGRIKNMLNSITGILTGGCAVTLIRFGFVSQGAAVLGIGLAAGALQKAIERRSRKRIDKDFLIAKAIDVLRGQPQPI